MTTLQEMYENLPSEGGVISPPPGRYDVGDGLLLHRSKPAVFTSAGRPGRAQREREAGSTGVGCPLVYSSTQAKTLVRFPEPNAAVNAYGFEFSNLNFEVSPKTKLVFDAKYINDMILENCGFFHHRDDTVEKEFNVLYADHEGGGGDDSSWMRIARNYVRGGTLIKAVGHNVNQWVIRENKVFPGPSENAAIYLEKAHRCVIRDNNLEGGIGVYLKESRGCRLDGNAGERTDPFIVLDNAHGNLITDMGIHSPGDAIFVQLINGSTDNFILSAVGTGMANLYNTADWIKDETPDKSNWIFAPSTHGNPERAWVSGLRRGEGNPEGVVKADPAELYQDKSSGKVYVKSSGWGQTGWRELEKTG